MSDRHNPPKGTAATVDLPAEPGTALTPVQPETSLQFQAELSGRRRNGTFEKGASGNLAGKPKGTRSYVNRLLDELAAVDAADILGPAIVRAKQGDLSAARLILRRTWTVPRSRPAEGLELPPLKTTDDALAAMSTVTTAISDGVISIEEARVLTSILIDFCKIHEFVDIERRLAKLEREKRAAGPRRDQYRNA